MCSAVYYIIVKSTKKIYTFWRQLYIINTRFIITTNIFVLIQNYNDFMKDIKPIHVL